MLLLLIAGLITQDHPADAYVSLSSLTGAVLASECAKDRGLQMDLCTSYVLGVADALQLQRVTCRPNNDAATLQTLAIVRRYIKDNPENWGWPPVLLVRTPLVKAFPCAHRRVAS